MNTIHHISFRLDPKVYETLAESGLKYKKTPLAINPAPFDYLISVDICENDPRWRLFASIEDAIDVRYYKYTNADLKKAEWLSVRGRMPTVDLAREEESFSISERIDDQRARHVVKQGKLFLKNQPNWGKRHFLCTYNLGENNLLCDSVAKQFFQKHKMQVSFEDVLDAKTELPLDNTFYMTADMVLPHAAVLHNPTEKKIQCPICRKIKYETGSDHQLHIDHAYLQTEHMICRTQDIFGSGNTTYSITIITQNVYRELLNDNLQRSLVFEPVYLDG